MSGHVLVNLVAARGWTFRSASAGLFEPAGRTAIVSDAVMGSGFDDLAGRRVAPPPYVDLAAYRATIERVRDLGAARLGTAHFPLLEGDEVGAFLDLSRRFTDDLERAIEAAGGGEVPMPELLPATAVALGGWPEMEVELVNHGPVTLIVEV